MKGNPVFFSKKKAYSKTLVLTDKPTLEIIDEIYRNHKTDGVLDTILMPLFHRKARQWFNDGFIDRPGRYRITISFSIPIMFWHKIYYNIEKL